jgi:hypothetical protein
VTPNNRPRLLRCAVRWLAAFALTTPMSACAQPAAGFTPLFDGTLDNAVVENGGAFTVVDGVLRAEGPDGWLRFREPARDFRLRLELRFVTDDGDSGVFLRAPAGITFARGWPNGSYQVQLLNPNVGGTLPILGGIFRHGMPPGEALVDRDAASAAFTGTNEWQLLEIEVVGGELTVHLNGVAVTRASNISDVPGYIGIQSETSAVEFRRIDIQRLERRDGPAAAAPVAVAESVPSGKCYTAVPSRDQGGNDVPIEPVCRVLEQNLNEFCDEPPLVCGVKIAPEFQADLALPTWTPVDFGGSLDLIESTIRAQWLGFNPQRIPGGSPQAAAAADSMWAERKPRLERALEEGRLAVSSAEIDLYQVGSTSSFYRVDPGDCEIDNGGTLQPDRPDYWNRRLVMSGVHVRPTPETLSGLLETFQSLSPEEPNGDVLLFRGQAYTYSMWGNNPPANIDNRVIVNLGSNYPTPAGPMLFFRNVCDIKYRSPTSE